MADPAAPPERPEPEWATDERTALLQFLGYYRTTLERQAWGLTDAQAASASVEPSPITITGLFRHMAEVERSWFRRCFAGEAVGQLYCSPEHPDGDFEVDATTSLPQAIDEWRAEVDAADRIVAGVSDPGQLSAGTSRLGGRPNLRWVLVHLIEEYARHAGHADLIRERIDGATDL